jgi:hypothetical protein
MFKAIEASQEQLFFVFIHFFFPKNCKVCEKKRIGLHMMMAMAARK